MPYSPQESQSYTVATGTNSNDLTVPVFSPVSPTSANINFPEGKRWINVLANQEYTLTSFSTSGGTKTATWTLLGSNSGPLNTLTGNSGGAISPSAGNINVIGSGTTTVAGSGSTLTISASASGYPITPYVVGPSGVAGYQTIQSAINAAHAAGGTQIIYIQPGTYTENLTFYDGIQLQGTQAYENSFSTIIVGVHTPPTSGAIAVSNVELQSATDIFFSNASGTSSISILNATFNITNGYTFNLPNWSGTGFNINNCGELSTNNGVVNNSGTANIFFNNCQVGAGTAKTFTTNGSQIRLDLTYVACPITISGSGLTLGLLTVFGNTLTVQNSANVQLFLGDFLDSGGNPALTTTSSTTVLLNQCSIACSATNAITGSGTVNLNQVGFSNSSGIQNTITVSNASTFETASITATGNMTLGSTSGATAIVQRVGSGNFSLDGIGASTYTFGPSTTSGTINFGGTGNSTGTITIAGGTGAQTINIANSTGGKTVAIATGAGANSVTLGSTNTTSATTLQSGSGGVTIATGSTAGNIVMTPATNSVAGTSITLNGRLGQATFTGQTTASGSSQAFTITNSSVSGTTQAILVSADNLGSNDAQMTITRVLQAANTLTVTLKNNGAAALNGDVHITFHILN